MFSVIVFGHHFDQNLFIISMQIIDNLLSLDAIQCTYMTFAYPAYVQSTAPLHITVYVYMST